MVAVHQHFQDSCFISSKSSSIGLDRGLIQVERRFKREMDYEKEMNDLKERVSKLEHRLDDLRSEVKTLYNYMERDSAGLR
jgi:cell division protein FtsB